MKRRVLSVIALLAGLLAVVVPAQRANASMATVTQFSAGGGTNCAVMTGGNAYCWGDNADGQLGNGTTTPSETPVLVAGGHTWSSISTQDDTVDSSALTCGVTTTNVGYCWGDDTSGQLGDGGSGQQDTPVLVAGGHSWASISVGWVDACGVTTTGEGYCWGMNWAGEDGNGSSGAHITTPTLVSGSYTWTQINIKSGTACGVTTTHVGYCWGFNGYGGVGNNTTSEQDSPALVSGGNSWAQITPGGEDSGGLTTSGIAYCWGHNVYGETGNGTNTEHDTPQPVSGGFVWSSIAENNSTSCGITTMGAGYCWGSNFEGQIGNNDNSDTNTPAAVGGGYTWSALYPGGDDTYHTTCGVTPGEILYCWGDNTFGQVGDGTTNGYWNPEEAALLYAATANTNLSVTIEPTFTFTVGNQPSACNSESNFVSGAGSSSAVALGNLAAGANVSGGQALSVSGNSGNGFSVYVSGTQASQNLRANGIHNWNDVSGTYATPAVLGAGERFGYTYHDSTASSSVTNPGSANFIALTSTNEAVMGSGSSESGTGCVSYDAQTSSATPAASYTATVIYTAVPVF